MKLRAIFVMLVLAVTAVTAQAQSLTFPALTGRVVDDAGILDANTRATLEKISADLEAKSTDQLVVVTLKSLQGTSIEDYGYQLGRHWQIGQKGKDNGVLLIVAPNERKVRIEVGYGLEGTLTDLISNFIIRNSILPRFRAGDFPGGITRGAQDISQVLMGDADEYKQRAAQANAAQQQQIDPVDMIILAFFVFMMITTIWNAIANMRRPGGIPAGRVRRTSNWAGAGPIILGSGWGGGGFGGGGWGGSMGGGFSGGGGSFGGGGSSGSW